MQKRPIQSKRRYFLAFLIGTLIFVFGFVLTYAVSFLEFQRISNFQEETSYNIFKDKLAYNFFGEDICSIEFLNEISGDLGFQGVIIDDLEKKFGKNDKKVLFRKRFYTLVELEHFEFVKTLNEKCERDIPTILFFYSNKKNDLGKSEEVGRLLDTVSRRNSDLIIYSFDINLNSELIRKLMDKYNIESSPTIIINDNKKIVNVRNIFKIEEYVGKVSGDVIWL